jgi:PAS domain-containing protein
MSGNKSSPPAAGSPFGKIVATNFRQGESLAGNENIFAAIFAALPAGIAALDDRLRVIDCNPAYARLLNISRENFQQSADTARKCIHQPTNTIRFILGYLQKKLICRKNLNMAI